MPYSYPQYKNEVKSHILSNIPTSSKILDVGPGCGTYSHLLRNEGYKIDAIEVWEPYVKQFELEKHYDNVFLGDIREFDFSSYDYIIMGDVLEHLSTEEAQQILDKINSNNQKCLIAVPYEYEQGEYQGNTYEIHLQPDLTPSNVLDRYPSLKLLYGNEEYGYYVNYTSELLIFIDGYLADQERADACLNLINQLKENLPYKIALLNKYPYSWGLDYKVDYYFHHGEGFMVGPPPQHLLDKQLYERPYVYVGTSAGTLENWLPLTGVNDHVANMYNSFLTTSTTARNLGFGRIFRVEADTLFDVDELKDIAKDLENFQDYLLYGERQEGDWAKPHHRIMDIHVLGYSVDLFKGFNLVKNDKQFWDLCSKINYYGKWIEYIIPTIIYYQQQHHVFNGIKYEGRIREKYPNTKFDLINSPGDWTSRWDNIPKICKVMPSKDSDELFNVVGLYYWNDEQTPLQVKSEVINEKNEIIYSKEVTVNPHTWIYDELPLEGEYIINNINTREGITQEFVNTVSPQTILDSNIRYIKK